MSLLVSHPSRRVILGGLAVLPMLAHAAMARPSALASDWSQASHSRMRLVSTGDARAPAAIELTFAPGFKTYWRHPGDSGVPPHFDFSKSENLADADVLFPAPVKFPDGAGGTSFGYGDSGILLPISIRAVDPAKPVMLDLKMDYAVCEKICVPAHGAARLQPGKALADTSDAFARIMAKVPVGLRQGEAGLMGMKLIDLERVGVAEHFRLAVDAGKDRIVDVFIEAEEPFLIETKAIAAQGSRTHVECLVVEKSKAADCTGAELRLTIVGEKSAIDVRTRLDLALIAP